MTKKLSAPVRVAAVGTGIAMGLGFGGGVAANAETTTSTTAPAGMETATTTTTTNPEDIQPGATSTTQPAETSTTVKKPETSTSVISDGPGINGGETTTSIDTTKTLTTARIPASTVNVGVNGGISINEADGAAHISEAEKENTLPNTGSPFPLGATALGAVLTLAAGAEMMRRTRPENPQPALNYQEKV